MNQPPKNAVTGYYPSYTFNDKLPVKNYNSYDAVLKAARETKESCVLYNTELQKLSNLTLDINLTYSKGIEVILILNLELSGFSTLKLTGTNYSVSNVSIVGGDRNRTYSTSHIVTITAPNVKLINFTMDNVKVKNSDMDYIRVAESASEFQLYNCKLDGKFNVGVFLRLDFPLKHYIKHCVFQNFYSISAGNGGEMIRMATSTFENKDAFATIDSCYFYNCQGDPEVVSVKCSSNTIKNCVFEDNKGKRLVLRHSHRDTIDNCLFLKNTGIRVYGSKHKFKNIQLTDGCNILLDNKSGASYVVANNCNLENIFHHNSPNPITNKGRNNTITNLVEAEKITKNDLLGVVIEIPPPEEPKDYKALYEELLAKCPLLQ